MFKKLENLVFELKRRYYNFKIMVYRKMATRPSLFKIFRRPGKLFFLLVILGLFIGFIVFTLYARDLPSPDKIVRQEGFATQITDRNGVLLYEVFQDQRRTPVNFDQTPLYLRQATIAIEDKDFYKHKGFDPRGWLRAIYNIFIHHKLQGGSTLTQQLVKNVLLTSDRTIDRKIKEFILALQIENKYSKDQILQMYLNEAPYGGTAWGVQAAAQVYFNKPLSDLNLLECALLAGLPQRPSYYSPYNNEDDKAYEKRTLEVLRRMREEGYINKDLEEKAKKELENLSFSSEGINFKAPHFVLYVKKLLIEKYGEQLVEQGGLKVTTTLDYDLQQEAQKIVTEEIAKTEKLNITNGAALVMDTNTGEILAMVGSKNYDAPDYDGKYNVVLSKRQPGSAIKPVTYLTALKKGYTASTLLMDVKTVFPGGDKPEYIPENYDGKEHGPIQMRYALGNSFNIPAVKMLALVGLKDTLQTAWEMGFSTLEPTSDNLSRLGLSFTLGGGEVKLIDMVSAYCAFANQGYKVEPMAIKKVEDRNGKILEENKFIPGKRIINPAQAFLISHILSDNNARLTTFGERSSIYIADRSVAVKTGTTNDRRDNWTVGWTPSIITGVWVGNNNNSSMKQLVSGISGAAPIWRRIINLAIENKPKEEFVVPDNIITAEVDLISGYRAHDNFPSRIEYFEKGTEPIAEDPVHVKLKTCKSSGKLATSIDIGRGDYDEKEFFVFKENDPVWQQGIDNWLLTQTDPRYHPPKDYCETNEQIEIQVSEPQNESTVNTSFRLSFNPISVNGISFAEVFIDNNPKATLTSRPYELNLSLVDGPHTIKIRVHDNSGNTKEREIKIGVNTTWNWVPPSLTPSLPAVSLAP